jgi:hypothetical protein
MAEPPCAAPGACPPAPCFTKEHDMAKGQQKGNKEARKPKKNVAPKQNASNPSLKGIVACPKK